MGIFTSCCKPTASDVPTPDAYQPKVADMGDLGDKLPFHAETRRRQQMEAAEKRRAQEASRGVKEPERLRRMQLRAEEMERREQELQKQGGTNLKWTAD